MLSEQCIIPHIHLIPNIFNSFSQDYTIDQQNNSMTINLCKITNIVLNKAKDDIRFMSTKCYSSTLGWGNRCAWIIIRDY